MPTAAARGGDLSAYGINIYDPQTGAPADRTQFGNNAIPQGRLSPQALALLKLIPMPNLPGTENGTRDNFVASGSELFNNDTFDVRVDGRINDRLNAFGRYSFADFRRTGPTAFGQGGGPELVSLGGTSKVRNQSLALGLDRSFGSNMTADFRLGYFKYKVAVLPFDYGTSPAKDAGIQGLNLDNTFTSGLFGGFVEGSRGFNFGSGLGVNRCNCPLDQVEKQLQLVGNVTRLFQNNHTVKVGMDVRRAWNLRVPSDRHRSGELSFNVDNTRGPSGGGLGLATFLLGNVTHIGRYISPFTDAGERQWRHFYYAQDTWRASPKLTLNYGLRLDVINPQTVTGASKGGFLLADVNNHQVNIPSPNMLVAGVGGVPLNGGIKNSLNWAPRAGATYQLTERTVLRAGYGRSYDIGVFGSLFGHTVTQNLPVLSSQDLSGANSFAAARRRCVQHHGAARAQPPDVDRSGVCRQSRRESVRRRRTGRERQPADAHGVSGPVSERAEAVLCEVRLEPGHQRVLQLRHEPVRLPADEADEAVREPLVAVLTVHAPARAPARRRPVLLPAQSRIRAGRLGPQAQLLDLDAL